MVNSHAGSAVGEVNYFNPTVLFSIQTAGSSCGTSRGSRWRRDEDSAEADHLVRSSSARRITRSIRSAEGCFFAEASEAAPLGGISRNWNFSKTDFMARSGLRR